MKKWGRSEGGSCFQILFTNNDTLKAKFDDQFSMISFLSREDGQPVSLEKFFIDNYTCPCTSSTSFFDNFLLSKRLAQSIASLESFQKCSCGLFTPKHPTGSH